MFHKVRIPISAAEDIELNAKALEQDNFQAGDKNGVLSLFMTEAGTYVLTKGVGGATVFCLLCAKVSKELLFAAKDSASVTAVLLKEQRLTGER